MNKTQVIVESLKSGPMKWNDLRKFLGENQSRNLLDLGIIRRFESENPSYAQGVFGTRPMCIWVELGDTQYNPPNVGCSRSAVAHRKRRAAIRADVEVLRQQCEKMANALERLKSYVENNLSSECPTGVDVNSQEFIDADAALSTWRQAQEGKA